MTSASSFEQSFDSRSTRIALALLLVHIPICLGTSKAFGTSMLQALVFSCFITAGPLLINRIYPASKVTAISVAIASMAFSGLLIHLGQGMIEMHFHVFVCIAGLMAFAKPSAIFVAAVTITIHHIAFFVFLPSSIFNYEVTLNIVLLHAVFVGLEAIPTFMIARRY